MTPLIATGLNEEYKSCMGVAVAPDGDIYFSDLATDKIFRYRTDGKIIEVNTGPAIDPNGSACFNGGLLDDPEEMVFGPDGLLYFAADRCVKRLRRDGSVQIVAGNGSSNTNGWPDPSGGVATDLPMTPGQSHLRDRWEPLHR